MIHSAEYIKANEITMVQGNPRESRERVEKKFFFLVDEGGKSYILNADKKKISPGYKSIVHRRYDVSDGYYKKIRRDAFVFIGYNNRGFAEILVLQNGFFVPMKRVGRAGDKLAEIDFEIAQNEKMHSSMLASKAEQEKKVKAGSDKQKVDGADNLRELEKNIPENRNRLAQLKKQRSKVVWSRIMNPQWVNEYTADEASGGRTTDERMIRARIADEKAKNMLGYHPSMHGKPILYFWGLPGRIIGLHSDVAVKNTHIRYGEVSSRGSGDDTDTDSMWSDPI